MRDKVLAIIIARGGSKRIPRKNIKDFCGKPIIAYSIEAAIKSDLFDEIMVSTEDDEIAQIGQQFGASVPFLRSEKTASDYATTAEVLLEVLEEYEKKGETFDYMMCIYPTAPFITPEKIKEAFTILKKAKCKEVLPVVKFSFPPQRAYIIDECGNVKYKWEEFSNMRSQDLEAFYHDAGQFYCYNVKKYIEMNGIIRDEICPIIVNETEVQDIDSVEDWKLAEIKYQLMIEKDKNEKRD